MEPLNTRTISVSTGPGLERDIHPETSSQWNKPAGKIGFRALEAKPKG